MTIRENGHYHTISQVEKLSLEEAKALPAGTRLKTDAPELNPSFQMPQTQCPPSSFWGSTSFLSAGPDYEYFRLCRPQSLCHNYRTLQKPPQKIHKWQCCDKILFIKTGGGPDLAHGSLFLSLMLLSSGFCFFFFFFLALAQRGSLWPTVRAQGHQHSNRLFLIYGCHPSPLPGSRGPHPALW